MHIDTHCHLDHNAFKEDSEDVIKRALAENVKMILVGTDRKSSKRALELANKYQNGVYAAAGLHPTNITENDSPIVDSYTEEFNSGVYEKFAKFEKIIAIGEIGLDYFHIDKSKNIANIKKKQAEILIEQIRIAREQNLPVILHCRHAHDDMVEILDKYRKNNKKLFTHGKPWGVVHCFSGDEDLAWKYFNMDLLISFTGIITFSKQWDDFIRRLPNDKFMIETDAPFLTPEPFRGKRNEPILVKYISKRIGEIKNLSTERIAEITTRNAHTLFGI
ncbi:MAG: TatD family hydrolase [Candidatus Falkowbacteria bacterium]|nr:TatD family hydrolase [Candidatus Falkowbacteria bacterium]